VRKSARNSLKIAWLGACLSAGTVPRFRLLLALAVMFGALLAPARVEAVEAASAHRLNWSYPRFRAWQYAGSAAVSATNLFIESTAGEYPDGRVRRTLQLDDWTRGALRIESASGRRKAATVSDYMWHTTQYYTVIVDSLIVPLVFDRGNIDVAWQMTMLNWQALGLAFFATRLAHLSVGRARPSEFGCDSGGDGSVNCRASGPSFLSGHTAMSAAGAGLACAHHRALPLYGGGAADTAACVVLAASTLTVGALRIASDKHWATDVAAGLVIGGTIGFGLPWLLHYDPSLLSAGLLPSNMALVPMVAPGAVGVTVAGWM
jgi:membrane-associated phospholipid phosphatase